MTRWQLKTLNIRTVVTARDQWVAFDTLRTRPAADFGLIVVAEPNESGEENSIPVRTSMLMFRWGRPKDAKAFIKAGMKAGMPDTTKQDSKAATSK